MFSTIEEVLLETNKRFFSNFHGEHISSFLGSGLEFSEIREYTIDDDIRHINWKTTAKTSTPSVNIYFENKRLDIGLILLSKKSLDFGSKFSKKDIANILMASLSYVAMQAKDNVTSLFFDSSYSEKKENIIKASSNKYHAHRVFEYGKNQNRQSDTLSYIKLCDTIISNMKQKSIIFLIGDFLELPDLKDIENSFEIYVLIVRDIKEENLELYGEYNLFDSVKQQSFHTNITHKTIKKYNKAMEKYDKNLYDYFKASNIKYQKIYTHENPIEVLEKFIKVINDEK